jgi:hypothetical protein
MQTRWQVVERSNEPSITALLLLQTTTDTIEIPPTEILDRIFIFMAVHPTLEYHEIARISPHNYRGVELLYFVQGGSGYCGFAI